MNLLEFASEMPMLYRILIIIVIGFIQTIRQAHQPGSANGLSFFYLSFAPPLFLFFFSQLTAVYVERALLPSGAIFCIWLAWVIHKTNLPRAAQYSLLGLLGISSALGIYQHVTYHDLPYGPFRELDRSLRQRIESQDVIVHANKMTLLPALLFDRNLPQSFIGDHPGSPVDTLAPATQEVLNIKAEKDIQSATQNATRVWYIIYQRAFDEFQTAGYSTHPDIQYLDEQYMLESAETWDSIRLLLYTKRP